MFSARCKRIVTSSDLTRNLSISELLFIFCYIECDFIQISNLTVSYLVDEAVHGLCILCRLSLTLNQAARRRGRVQVQLVKVTCDQYKESSGEHLLTDTQVKLCSSNTQGSGGARISQVGETTPKVGCQPIIFWLFVPKYCMKLNKI